MSLSGRDTLSRIEDAIADVRTAENGITSVLAAATQEADRLRRSLAESLRALALIRLDELARNTAVGELDSAERRALEILRTQKARLDQVQIRHGGAQAALLSAQAVHREKTGAVETVRATIAKLQAEVEARMAADPAWASQHDAVARALDIARAADGKADVAEADREAKRKPYEDDPLFMYLQRRGFGTPAYTAGGLVRYMDRKVAALVVYDTARPNYTLLNEIPRRLRDHATMLAQKAQEADGLLEQIERKALAAAGIEPLEASLAAAETELKSATATLTRAEAALAAIDTERKALLEDGGRRANEEAVTILTQAIAREDLQTMLREARATPTPEDDRIVAGIGQLQQDLATADSRVASLRNDLRDSTNRRSELEGVRDRFRARRFDRPGSEFDFSGSADLGDMIGKLSSGAIQGGILWALLENAWRQRGDWYDVDDDRDDDDDDRDDDDDDDDDDRRRGPWRRHHPRFRFPSSSVPRFPGGFGGGGFGGGGFGGGGFGGGGFRGGGSFGGGGFRTGGKF